jgi:U2 small nuclear ribonucleoprotein A'
MMARNRINQIQPTIASSIPNLTALILISNNMAELADLDPLRNLSRLTHLVLMENPVTRKEVSGKRLWQYNSSHLISDFFF